LVSGRKFMNFVQTKIQKEFTEGKVTKKSFKYLGINMEVSK